MSVSEPILSDLRLLQPGAVVELYVLDATNIPGGTLSRFHAGTNGLRTSVVWQGNTYQPWPIKAEGFAMTGQGTLPRPNIRVSNVGGVIGALCRDLQDLVGAGVTRKRTLVKYLDAANFGGANPTANPNAYFEDDVFEIQRKVSETEDELVFELTSALDLQGRLLPQRQILANLCPYIYRTWVSGTSFSYTAVDQCPYTGTGYFDATNAAVAASADRCSHTVAGCQARYPGKVALPFGGFPGAGIVTG